MVAFTEPLIQQTMERWSQAKIDEIEKEREEFSVEHDKQTGEQLEEYLKETARQNLINAATAALHWFEVNQRSYEQFCISFAPTADAMDPELIAQAGGIDAILRQTWIHMPRYDRSIIEDKMRKEIGGLKDTSMGSEGYKFQLGTGEVKKWRVTGEGVCVLKASFAPAENAKPLWEFQAGDKIRQLEGRINED